MNPVLIIKATRPRQWTKNVLLLAGLFLASHYQYPESIIRALLGFVAFCLVSGGVYVLNDIIDFPRDRVHPEKCKRPIASGDLRIRPARWLAGWLFAGGIALAFHLSLEFGLCAAGYVLMMTGYCFGMKDVFLIDTQMIAMGFLIRAIAGVIVLRTPDGPAAPLTPWFVICILFLSMLLAFCKRHSESQLLADNKGKFRPVLEFYTRPLTDILIAVSAGGAILAYTLYCMQEDDQWLVLSTLPLVFFGIFRYLHLVYNMKKGDAPEKLVTKDLPLLGTTILWVIISAFIRHIS